MTATEFNKIENTYFLIEEKTKKVSEENNIDFKLKEDNQIEAKKKTSFNSSFNFIGKNLKIFLARTCIFRFR